MRDFAYEKWQYKLDLSSNMLAFERLNQRKTNGGIVFSKQPTE